MPAVSAPAPELPRDKIKRIGAELSRALAELYPDQKVKFRTDLQPDSGIVILITEKGGEA